MTMPTCLWPDDSAASVASSGCKAEASAHSGVELYDLDTAIVRTVAYADVFDYPLTVQEIHRYLIGVSASLPDVYAALSSSRVQKRLDCSSGFATLPDRQDLVTVRWRRMQISARMWPRAMRYGQMIAALPYVRMVALTGALAMSNADARGDMDYLVVTRVGRLWLCRALVIALVRLVARRGDTICPNYFLSERTLAIQQRNLYTAHEIVQMVPIAGQAVYRRMMQTNAWTSLYLPNAVMQATDGLRDPSPPLRGAVEAILAGRAGRWAEEWEMRRKIRKFAQFEGNRGEADFCADWCKGHFDAHGQAALAAYAVRLQILGLEP